MRMQKALRALTEEAAGAFPRDTNPAQNWTCTATPSYPLCENITSIWGPFGLATGLTTPPDRTCYHRSNESACSCNASDGSRLDRSSPIHQKKSDITLFQYSTAFATSFGAPRRVLRLLAAGAFNIALTQMIEANPAYLQTFSGCQPRPCTSGKHALCQND